MKEFSEPIINRPTDDALVLWLAGRGSRREGTMLADLSKKGNTGTLTNSPVWKNTPLGHNVLDFTAASSQYITCGDPADGSLDLGTGDFSMGAWIKPDTIDTTRRAFIGKKATSAANDPGIFIAPMSDYNGIRVSFADGSGNVQIQPTSDQTALLSSGSWYHIFVIADRSASLTLHIDGSNVGSSSITGVSGDMDNAVNFRIGLFSTSYFDGMIDDVRVYKRKLTVSELSNIYNETRHYYGK